MKYEVDDVYKLIKRANDLLKNDPDVDFYTDDDAMDIVKMAICLSFCGAVSDIAIQLRRFH